MCPFMFARFEECTPKVRGEATTIMGKDRLFKLIVDIFYYNYKLLILSLISNDNALSHRGHKRL